MIPHHPLLLLAGTALLATATTQAAVVVSYQADATNPAQTPTLQGWSEGGNLAVPGSAASELIGSTTYRYWNISNPTPATNGASLLYRNNFTNTTLNSPDGWTATAILRVESAPSEAANALLEVANGDYFWSLNITRTSVGGSHINYINNTGAMISLGTFDTASDYFTLQMYYDRDDQTLQVYVNGEALGAALGKASFRTALSSNLFIRWGDTDPSPRDYRTVSHWNTVRLETGYAVVPEPSSLLALGLGAGTVLLCLNRRKRPCAG